MTLPDDSRIEVDVVVHLFFASISRRVLAQHEDAQAVVLVVGEFATGWGDFMPLMTHRWVLDQDARLDDDEPPELVPYLIIVSNPPRWPGSLYETYLSEAPTRTPPMQRKWLAEPMASLPCGSDGESVWLSPTNAFSVFRPLVDAHGHSDLDLLTDIVHRPVPVAVAERVGHDVRIRTVLPGTDEPLSE